MIQGIQGRGEAHASIGIAHAHQGLALGHRRRAAEPAGHDASAQPAAIVTLSQQGRALAQRAIEAERGQALGHRPKVAKRPATTLQAAPAGAGSLSAGTGAGGALEGSAAIATRRAIPRGIAKKLAASLTLAAPATPIAAGLPTPTTQTTQVKPTARPALAETEAATPTTRTGRGPAWGHLIRHGGQDAAAAAEPASRPARAKDDNGDKDDKAVGRSTRHEDDPRLSARALMQAAAARLVAEARTRRDDQKAEMTGGSPREAAEAAHAPHEKAHPTTPAQRAPQAASAAVAAAAEQAGLAQRVPEASAQ